MNLYCYMVTKNEAGRYLDACLAWAAPKVDGIAVFDDQSTDDTVEVAGVRGAKVKVRDGGSSFMEHEAQFRRAAWGWLSETFAPRHGDWVLALDADEFLLGDPKKDVVAVPKFVSNLRVGIPEVFDLDGPKVRSDGFWGKITSPRLFPWTPDPKFAEKAMGCGSGPIDPYCSAFAQTKILHYGYAHPDDRAAKAARYSTIAHGHNDRHINSILQPPTLRLWQGEVPEVWRGRRG